MAVSRGVAFMQRFTLCHTIMVMVSLVFHMHSNMYYLRGGSRSGCFKERGWEGNWLVGLQNQWSMPPKCYNLTIEIYFQTVTPEKLAVTQTALR